MYVPGQQIRKFDVYRKKAKKDKKGRVLGSQEVKVTQIRGSIALTNQREVDRFKQLGYPVTHTIIVQLRCDVEENDVLVKDDERYHVKGVKKPADLGFYTVIYCEKKAGE